MVVEIKNENDFFGIDIINPMPKIFIVIPAYNENKE